MTIDYLKLEIPFGFGVPLIWNTGIKTTGNPLRGGSAATGGAGCDALDGTFAVRSGAGS